MISKLKKLFISIYCILKKIYKCIPVPENTREWNHVLFSYSQFGEDLQVFNAIYHFQKRSTAYYIDVGCFDPVIYSNTLKLHKIGWTGINIDPVPEHIEKFKVSRPKDKNLQIAISSQEGVANFLCYESGATGKLLMDNSLDKLSLMGEKPIKNINVKTTTLNSVITQNAPKEIPFGFLSIDCEGHELDVLKGNNWEQNRPWIVAVEDHNSPSLSELDSFMNSNNYRLFSLTQVTKIYVDSNLDKR
jgi:FkbM family methyltransferase